MSTNLDFNLYHKAKFTQDEILMYQKLYYPKVSCFEEYYGCLMEDVNEYTATKHHPSFRSDKKYEQLIPHIQLGIKLLVSLGRHDLVAEIYRLFESNRTRLLGYSFKNWMYDLTILSDDDFISVFLLIPDVYESRLNNYKIFPYDISSIAKRIGRTGNKQAIDELIKITNAIPDSERYINEALTAHYTFYDEVDHTELHSYNQGLIENTITVKPISEKPKEKRVVTYVDQEVDVDKIERKLQEDRSFREKQLQAKIAFSKKDRFGLLPHEIAALHESGFYSLSCIDPHKNMVKLVGVDDVSSILLSLRTRGFLEDASAGFILSKSTVAELSKFLKKNGLKCSGRKAELVARILEGVSQESILESFQERYLVPTELGNSVLEAYPFLPDLATNINNIYWYGQRCDLWRIFSDCKLVEEQSLSDIALQMGLHPYESTDGLNEYLCVDLETWNGEVQTFQRANGEHVDVPVSPFLDRDCNLYDFDYEVMFNKNIE